MANTYTQLNVQFVFAPRYRNALIRPEWTARFHQYTTAIVQANKHKLLQINSMADHTHMLVGMRTHQSVADLLQKIKADTSKWFKTQQSRYDQPFAWQDGYGAFSYSRQDVDTVIRYIQNQAEHHKEVSFLDEYRGMLNEAGIEWKEEYIFREPE